MEGGGGRWNQRMINKYLIKINPVISSLSSAPLLEFSISSNSPGNEAKLSSIGSDWFPQNSLVVLSS